MQKPTQNGSDESCESPQGSRKNRGWWGRGPRGWHRSGGSVDVEPVVRQSGHELSDLVRFDDERGNHPQRVVLHATAGPNSMPPAPQEGQLLSHILTKLLELLRRLILCQLITFPIDLVDDTRLGTLVGQVSLLEPLNRFDCH